MQFQWAPTLGGECYSRVLAVVRWLERIEFQWAPTLVGECYSVLGELARLAFDRFNGHPPLWVNATDERDTEVERRAERPFQWAPTLVGECYHNQGNLEEEV